MLKCSMPQWAGGRQAPCSLVRVPSTSPLGPGTHQQWRTWSRCCILQLSWTRPAVHCRCVPDLDGLVEGKHHVLWFWCLQPVHWGLEHVSSDQHGGMFHGANATTQQNGAWNASAVTGAVVEQYTACFVYNVWKQSYLAYNTVPPFYIYLLYMIYYCSIQAQSTALATPRAMVCCLKLLSATFGNAEVFHAPMGWWKASTMFFGADAFNQSIGAWNMSAVTNMGGCSMELLPPPRRLVPGTHQQWRTWSRCCILQLSWTRPAVHCQCVPNLDGLVQGKHHVLWFWCLQPVHWGLEHVSSDQHCSVELMPQTNRLVPGTHQQWRTWSRCCILQLSWTRPAVHCQCVPNLDGLVQGKHHVLWFWCLQTVHWGLEHVSSDQHGGMFHGATATTQQIGAWNASAMTDMESMLYSAVVLNQTSCSLPMCPKSWWTGPRQAPCSLVLMPSNSPLGPGTCQHWPTWGDVPWSYCHHPADWCLERISSDWRGGGTVYCMLCIQCLKTKLPGILAPFYIYLLYMICYCSIQAQVQLPQLLALWFAVWSCFRQPLAMLECSMPQWAGGRQAPCSLVLMPSTSPCWSSLEFKSLNDLTTWGLRPKGWLQLTPTVHTTKDWWTSNVGMQSVLALSKWLGSFLFMSFMYANVTL